MPEPSAAKLSEAEVIDAAVARDNGDNDGDGISIARLTAEGAMWAIEEESAKTAMGEGAKSDAAEESA